jgi:hypothetical protein
MAKPPAALEMEAIVNDAIARSERGANPEWLDAAYWVVRKTAAQRSELSSDDIWFRLQELGVKTPDHRAMGAVMRRAAREGIIEPTGVYRKSFRRICHGRPVALWRSCWKANGS